VTPRHIRFSPDGGEILVAGLDEFGAGRLIRYSYPEGSDQGEFPLSGRPVSAFAAGQDGGEKFWASADGQRHSIAIWGGDGEKRATIGSAFALVSNVRISAEGLIGLGGIRTASEETAGAAIESGFNPKTLSLRPVSADARLESARFAEGISLQSAGPTIESQAGILRGSITQEISVGGRLKAKIVSGPLNGFSHRLATMVEDKLLVCGGDDGMLLAYDLDGRLLAKLIGCEGDILSLASSASGSWVAASAADHTVRVWDLSAQKRRHGQRRASQMGTATIMRDARYGLLRLGYTEDDVAALKSDVDSLG